MSNFGYKEDDSGYSCDKLSELYRKTSGLDPLEKAKARQLLSWKEKLYKLSDSVIR